jgi:hypothetical protein
MKTLYLLFNHSLTQSQEADAQEALGVERFEALPESLQKLWSQVTADLENLLMYLEPIKVWIEQAKPADYVLIQGDYGATVHLVQYCQQGNFGLPIYSTTTRQTHEIKQPDGSIEVKRTIKHCRFRIYT